MREEEEEVDERPRYQKKEDQTFKIVGGIAAVLVLIAGSIFGYTQMTRSAQQRAAQEAFDKSERAFGEIKTYVDTNTDDGSIEAAYELIKKNKPFLQEARLAEVVGLEKTLDYRKELRERKKVFNEGFDFVKANATNAERAPEVKKKIDELYKMLDAGLRTSIDEARIKDFAAFKVQNSVAILEAKFNKALQVKESAGDNWKAITEAFTEAEETMSDDTQQLIKSGVPGSERAKELFERCREEVNRSADAWASSEKLGFSSSAATSRNLLDAKEFQGLAEGKANWFNTSSAEVKLEGGRMVLKGLASKESSTKSTRAGVLNWGPTGKSSEVVNGRLQGVIRNYELTMKFKIVKKGFTLLSRQYTGYQRHSYQFETKNAQGESKSVDKQEQAQGGGGAVDIFNNARPPAAGDATDDTSAFVVEEGKSYEVVNRVYGNKVWFKVKGIDSGEDPDPIEDAFRARYGGVGFRVLPGAEVIFESMSIKILN